MLVVMYETSGKINVRLCTNTYVLKALIHTYSGVSINNNRLYIRTCGTVYMIPLDEHSGVIQNELIDIFYPILV